MPRSTASIIRNLQRRNARRRSALAVLEGVRLVEDAIAAGVTLEAAVVSPALERTERGAALLGVLESAAVAVERVDDPELVALADTETPQGVIALAPFAPRALADLDPAGVIVVLDGMGNPGNAGAVLRTAHAFGATAAVLVRGTVLPNHPKLLRAAMGAAFRLPLATADRPAARAWLDRHEIARWIAAADGRSVMAMKAPERLAVIIGSEGEGVSAELEEDAAARVAVPIGPDTESLNAAVAAGIILHEVLRDR